MFKLWTNRLVEKSWKSEWYCDWTWRSNVGCITICSKWRFQNLFMGLRRSEMGYAIRWCHKNSSRSLRNSIHSSLRLKNFHKRWKWQNCLTSWSCQRGCCWWTKWWSLRHRNKRSRRRLWYLQLEWRNLGKTTRRCHKNFRWFNQQRQRSHHSSRYCNWKLLILLYVGKCLEPYPLLRNCFHMWYFPWPWGYTLHHSRYKNLQMELWNRRICRYGWLSTINPCWTTWKAHSYNRIRSDLLALRSLCWATKFTRRFARGIIRSTS